MPRRKPLAPQLERRARQQAELHHLVAPHARIRGLSPQIGFSDILQDVSLPFSRKVKDLEGNSKPFCGGLRLGQRLRLVGTAERHRDADDLMALFLQEQGRHGRIDAARDANCDLHHVSSFSHRNSRRRMRS